LTPPDPQLKGAWFQPFHLSSEKPVSKFAFQVHNLDRYIEVRARGRRVHRGVAPMVGSVQVELGFRV
jgi:hypothetical protein